MPMDENHLTEAQKIAEKITKSLGGAGIWGVEFFISKDGPIFSELSPRPHDTGMVTLANTQNFSEFELHARAILGIPIKNIKMHKNGASAVILADKLIEKTPLYEGIKEAAKFEQTDFKIFGKPSARPFRRMGVALSYGSRSVEELVKSAKEVASCIKIY